MTWQLVGRVPDCKQRWWKKNLRLWLLHTTNYWSAYNLYMCAVQCCWTSHFRLFNLWSLSPDSPWQHAIFRFIYFSHNSFLVPVGLSGVFSDLQSLFWADFQILQTFIIKQLKRTCLIIKLNDHIADLIHFKYHREASRWPLMGRCLQVLSEWSSIAVNNNCSGSS